MNADRVLTYLISNMRIEPSFPQVRNVSGFSEENAISYISFVCALIFDTGCCETISQSVQIPSRLTAPIILVFTSLQSNEETGLQRSGVVSYGKEGQQRRTLFKMESTMGVEEQGSILYIRK